MRRPAVLVSALGLLVSLGLTVPGSPAPAAESAQGRSVAVASGPGERLIGPGRIGKAKVGITVEEAMATGQFNQDVPNPPCDPIALQPKKPYRDEYVVFVADGRIVEMNGTGSTLRSKTGARVLSTYRKLQSAYGDQLSKPREVGFGQWAVFVHTGGEKADRKWLGFLFGDSYVDDGELSRNDIVTLVGVTKGMRPPLILDGC